MSSWLAKMEYKFGKYAIRNLTLILIICYIIGYVIQMADQFRETNITYYLTLNPYEIVHGQVWRLFSWVLIPPEESNFFFAIIMLLFYFSIGRTLEHAWGDFQYNVYMFSGMIFTIIGAFLTMGFCYWRFYDPEIQAFVVSKEGSVLSYVETKQLFNYISVFFSTYYVNMSIFLAYAATFPEQRVYLMFILPIKVKYLGIVYGVFIVYEMVVGFLGSPFGFVYPFAIGSSLLNFLVFFLSTRSYFKMNRMQRDMHRAFQKQAREFRYQERAKSSGVISKHKCAVCGRTEKDGDDLIFRFCSKCDGDYEYCQDHLYTHIHFSKGGNDDNT